MRRGTVWSEVRQYMGRCEARDRAMSGIIRGDVGQSITIVAVRDTIWSDVRHYIGCCEALYGAM